MDFASYMESLVVFCQVMTEFIACFFPFSFYIRFGLTAVGLLFFIWLCFCFSPLGFLSPLCC